MADEKKQLSFGDLCVSLVDEFAASLVMVKRSHPSVVVHSLKLNLGQIPETAPETADQPTPLILTERYPESDKGWQLQLELGERPAATFAGIKRPLPAPLTATALDLFADYPLDVVDGISSKWSESFARFEIIRIRDLARLDDAGLQKIITETRSLKVREFRQKVLLLGIPIPSLPHSSLDELSLYRLLQFSPAGLHQQLGFSHASSAEVQSLVELLDILNLALDNRLMKKIPLLQLLDS